MANSAVRVALVVAFLGAIALVAAHGLLTDPRSEASSVTNADVLWLDDDGELEPRLVGSSAREEVAAGRDATERLIAAMSYHERFAAAHVVLTQIYGPLQPGFTADPRIKDQPMYNGLVVTRDADGRPYIPNTQRWRLRAYWQLRLEAESDA